MSINLFEDIRDDPGFVKSLLRVALFILLLLFLDFGVSVFLEKGINRFYGLDGDAEILMVGHSHLMLAVDKRMLEERTGMRVAKYTREGVNVSDRYIMLRQYFGSKKGKTRLVVYGIDPWLFTSDGLSVNSYKLFYPFMDNPWVDRYVHRESKDVFDYLGHKLFRSARFDVLLINAALRGYLGNWSNLKFGEIDSTGLKREIASGEYRRIRIEKENVRQFEHTLRFLADKHVTVILLNTPVYHLLTDVQPEKYSAAMELMRRVAARYPNVRLLDLSPGLARDSRYFFDAVHMNPYGQKRVTGLFSEAFDSLGIRH